MNEDGKNIKILIDNLFKKSGKLSKSYNQFTIEEVWRDCFGDVISSYTSKMYYNKEILTVYITSAPLKEEILMNKIKVIEQLNSKLQYRKVKDLRVR